MNIMFGFRTLDPDPERSAALVAGVRIYPYAQRDDPPPTRIVTPDGRAWTGDQPRGLAYWERLHDIYQSEIVDERDRFYLAMLKQLGIEKGTPFAPDDRLRGILEDGVGGRRAHGAGQHLRQAVPGCARSGPTASGTSRSCSTTRRSAASTTTSCSSAPRGSTRRSASPRR